MAMAMCRFPVTVRASRLNCSLLRPERVTVVAGAMAGRCAWRYKVGETVVELPLEDENGWPCGVHIRSFHPTDDHYGAGCLGC